jgi:transcriptional regulator of arginine metabolism
MNIGYNCSFKRYNYSFVKNRTERIALIKKIVSEEVISNQDELQFRLKELGSEVTQATLSRDLRFMQVVKVNEGGKGYVYRLSSSSTKASAEKQLQGQNFWANTVTGIDFSGNLGVLKTLPGYANSIAILIDKFNAKELLGTIAGDDTILIIIREGVKSDDVIEVLRELGITN